MTPRCIVSVGRPVYDEVCEGLEFDCISFDELYYEVVDFGGPLSNSPYGFWVLKDVVKWKTRGYDDLVRLEIVLEFSGGHNDCVCYLLHLCIELFGTIEGLRYIIYW